MLLAASAVVIVMMPVVTAITVWWASDVSGCNKRLDIREKAINELEAELASITEVRDEETREKLRDIAAWLQRESDIVENMYDKFRWGKWNPAINRAFDLTVKAHDMAETATLSAGQ